MQPIVVVTDPEGRLEAFTSVQAAIEENYFNSGNYKFYWAQSQDQLHRDSARGMSLPEVYLATRYNPDRQKGFCNTWFSPHAVVIVKHVDSPTEEWVIRFTYIYV